MIIRQHLTELGYCTAGGEHTDTVDRLLAVDAILAVDAQITLDLVLDEAVDPLNTNAATEEINFEAI